MSLLNSNQNKGKKGAKTGKPASNVKNTAKAMPAKAKSIVKTGGARGS